MKNYELYEHPQVGTLKELLDYCVTSYANRTAFAYQVKKQDVTISFKQFSNNVAAFGSYLLHNGYQNSHIAVFGENSYEWILTHFAVTCSKNVIVPIDKELDAESISELLIDSKSKVLVYSNTYADIVDSLKQMNIEGLSYISMKDIAGLIAEGNKLIAEGYTAFADIEVNRDDLASIVYTSGTTGKSKGVMLTHYNFCSCMYGACCNAYIYGTSLLLLPLHHTFGLVASVYAVMFYGLTIYINKSLKNLLDDFKKCQPQHLFVVPLIVETLYKNIWNTAKKQGKDKALRFLIKISNALRKCGIDIRKTLFKSVISAFGGNLDVIICGGAPLSEQLVSEFDSIGITLLNGYGITECGPIVAVNRNKFNIPGSVGLPLVCNEVSISDEGEVLVKGDNVMQGYYHNDAENAKAFTDGWFRTGDIGSVDEYGALHITGRIKNLIILSNGENIAAEYIEEQVYTILYVKEVVAYGKDDVITAEVYLDEEVPDAGERIHEDIAILNRTLPITKNIGKIVIRDSGFPKTTTKKIKRNYAEV